jgi:acetyltransferase-like isoleucine patch superfamily enzyme
MTNYEQDIRSRGVLRYWLGFFARLVPWLKIRWKLRKMRKKGAVVGDEVGIASNIMPPASKNLKIGNYVSIQTDRIDVRAPLKIGDYVILGDSASIITCSHNIDDPEWKFKAYGLEIEDYVWISTRAMILPSCRKIGRGAVIGAGAVVVKDVPPMAVVSGNPAQVIRYRKCVHTELKPNSLLGGGLLDYIKIRFSKNK